MNTKRVVGWLGFFGVAAALAWLPEYFMPADEGDAAVASVTTPGKSKIRGALPAAPATGNAKAVKDLSPAGDLFATRSWKAAPTLASVVEQPVNLTPVVQAPSMPPMPFQFVGCWMTAPTCKYFCRTAKKYTSYAKGM